MIQVKDFLPVTVTVFSHQDADATQPNPSTLIASALSWAFFDKSPLNLNPAFNRHLTLPRFHKSKGVHLEAFNRHSTSKTGYSYSQKIFPFNPAGYDQSKVLPVTVFSHQDADATQPNPSTLIASALSSSWAFFDKSPLNPQKISQKQGGSSRLLLTDISHFQDSNSYTRRFSPFNPAGYDQSKVLPVTVFSHQDADATQPNPSTLIASTMSISWAFFDKVLLNPQKISQKQGVRLTCF